MSDEDLLRKAIEGIVEGGIPSVKKVPADSDNWDLPKILVEEDRIVVLEDWFEDSVEGEDVEEDSGEVLEEIVGEAGEVSSGVDVLEVSGGLDLEGRYKDASKSGGDFYKSEFYDSKVYDSGEVEEYVVSSDVGVFVEGERRGERSMLEIAGFEDEEAERKRKEKREGNFI